MMALNLSTEKICGLNVKLMSHRQSLTPGALSTLKFAV